MIKPTIGRIVWFHPAPADPIVGNDGTQPFAAIITRVWSGVCVNLAIFDANGTPTNRTSVSLLQDAEAGTADRMYCEWMPYQKGQAAKVEQPGQKLAG